MQLTIKKSGVDKQVRKMSALALKRGFKLPLSLVHELCATALFHRDWNTLVGGLDSTPSSDDTQGRQMAGSETVAPQQSQSRADSEAQASFLAEADRFLTDAVDLRDYAAQAAFRELLINWKAAISDGWSLEVLVRDLDQVATLLTEERNRLLQTLNSPRASTAKETGPDTVPLLRQKFKGQELQQEFGQECPRFSREDWNREVAIGCKLSYWEYVADALLSLSEELGRLGYCIAGPFDDSMGEYYRYQGPDSSGAFYRSAARSLLELEKLADASTAMARSFDSWLSESGTTNKDKAFEPGEEISFQGKHYIVLQNFGSYGKVRKALGDWECSLEWVFEGEPCRRVPVERLRERKH